MPSPATSMEAAILHSRQLRELLALAPQLTPELAEEQGIVPHAVADYQYDFDGEPPQQHEHDPQLLAHDPQPLVQQQQQRADADGRVVDRRHGCRLLGGQQDAAACAAAAAAAAGGR